MERTAEFPKSSQKMRKQLYIHNIKPMNTVCNEISPWASKPDKGKQIQEVHVNILFADKFSFGDGNGNHVCMLSHFSCVQLCATSRTIAHQPPLSMGFPKKEFWCGLPCPPPAVISNTGTDPASHEQVLHCRQILNHWVTAEAPWRYTSFHLWLGIFVPFSSHLLRGHIF